jgi:riboflavin synthase
MFSGIIYDTGRVKAIRQGNGVKVITIALSREILKPEKGMSIAVNGACLTAVSFRGVKEFSADVTEETLKKTVIKDIKPGDEVNVEFPLTLDKFLSGHLVQGHVDCAGSVSGVEKIGDKVVLKISYPKEFGKYIIEKGSVTVSGISLTAYEVKNNGFEVSIIPETYKSTIVKNLKRGDDVNLEFDLIGKYVEKFLAARNL